MQALATHPRDLLTVEQQEMYDGVLAESATGTETAVSVLARYAVLVQEQARDVAAVRAALMGNGTQHTPLAAGSACTGRTGAHPAWCARSHSPDAAHASAALTIEQGHLSHTH